MHKISNFPLRFRRCRFQDAIGCTTRHDIDHHRRRHLDRIIGLQPIQDAFDKHSFVSWRALSDGRKQKSPSAYNNLRGPRRQINLYIFYFTSYDL